MGQGTDKSLKDWICLGCSFHNSGYFCEHVIRLRSFDLSLDRRMVLAVHLEFAEPAIEAYVCVAFQ